mmetsp:Transcript_42827/g.102084  ORF Transcript_42827/g.102084 Transcript_42827/m.102084 type:complete len:207 (-) Transcript_42827:345-965(-)
MVRCTSESPPDSPSTREEPMESTSSMKMMVGACSRAMTKSSRTILLPSPMYFCTSSPPETRMKQQLVWCATARASSVLPVPGGPTSSAPLGIFAPSSEYREVFFKKSTTSTSSCLAPSQPATSANLHLVSPSLMMRALDLPSSKGLPPAPPGPAGPKGKPPKRSSSPAMSQQMGPAKRARKSSGLPWDPTPAITTSTFLSARRLKS